jgi:hypothetical protein
VSNFVLISVGPGVWKGTAGETVQINVESDDANATKLLNAAYPGGTAINPDQQNKFEFKISDDASAHTLTVQIAPPAAPDDWQIVEVGKDGTTQELAGFDAGDPDGDVVIQRS